MLRSTENRGCRGAPAPAALHQCTTAPRISAPRTHRRPAASPVNADSKQKLPRTRTLRARRLALARAGSEEGHPQPEERAEPPQDAPTSSSSSSSSSSAATYSPSLSSFFPVGILDGLHAPLAQVLFPAYVLGASAELLDVMEPPWLACALGAAIGAAFVLLDAFCRRRLWAPPKRPLRVVITGASRGLGKALAREFLASGDHVVVAGRGEESLQAAVEDLRAEAATAVAAAARAGGAAAGGSSTGGGGAVHGVVCDVSSPASVAELDRRAVELLGGVDVWLNNAAFSGSFQPLGAASPQTVEEVVRTNLLGCLLASRQAARLGLAQAGAAAAAAAAEHQHQQQQGDGGGMHLFNMDGAGADGLATPNYAAYGATKAGIAQLTRSLQQELRGTPVHVHALSPGMMLTELLLEGATLANKRVFNILCEQPETVAAFLVPRVKSVVARGLDGTYVRYLTPLSALGRFLTAPARTNRFFDGATGDAVYLPERERISGRHAKATARATARARSRTGGLQLAYSLSITLCVFFMALEAHALPPYR